MLIPEGDYQGARWAAASSQTKASAASALGVRKQASGREFVAAGVWAWIVIRLPSAALTLTGNR
jgi:hypothetical protein